MRKRKSNNKKMATICQLSHKEQVETCFYVNSDEYKSMMEIIDRSDPNKWPLHKHHIVPRSWFNKRGYEVDNSDENIAYITPYEHFLVHQYAWKCAKPVIKRSMAFAANLMRKAAVANTEDLDSLAKGYSDTVIFTDDLVNERLQKIGSSFRCKSQNRNGIVFRCSTCGYEKTVSRNWHKDEAICTKCKFTHNHPYIGRYPLIMAICRDKKARYVTGEELPISRRHKEYRSTWQTLMVHASRGMTNRASAVIKWKLVGATDKKINLPSYIPCVSKETVESYFYWYKTDKSMIRLILKNNSNTRDTFNRMKKAAEYYNIDINNVSYYENKTGQTNIYYLPDFLGYHTAKEWETILGHCWGTIKSKYNPQCIGPSLYKSVLEFLPFYNEDPTILSKIKDFFDALKNKEYSSCGELDKLFDEFLTK